MYKSCSLPAAGSNDTMYNYSITYDLISRSGWRKLFARAFQEKAKRGGGGGGGGSIQNQFLDRAPRNWTEI